MRRAKEEDRRESNPVVLDVKVRENGVMMSMRMTMMVMFVYLTRKAYFKGNEGDLFPPFLGEISEPYFLLETSRNALKHIMTDNREGRSYLTVS